MRSFPQKPVPRRQGKEARKGNRRTDERWLKRQETREAELNTSIATGIYELHELCVIAIII